MRKSVPIKMHPNAFAAFGPELVTNDVVALMELIKNCYDAYAYNVNISFGTKNGISFLEIIDDGIGMTRDTIENVWAVVATPYKRKNPTVSRNGGIRRVSGNKGMGRFSSARLGKKLEIYTKHVDDEYIHAIINWEEILDPDSENECTILVEEIDSAPISSATGTKIVISSLNSVWSDNDFEELVESLGRIMSPFEEVSDFSINLSVSSDDGKTRKMICVTPPAFIKHPVYSIYAKVDSQGNVKWNYEHSNPKSKKTRSVNGHIDWADVYSGQIKNDTANPKRKLISDRNASCGEFSLEIRAWDLDPDSVGSIADVFDISKSSVRSTLRAYKGISIYRDGVLVLPKSEASRDWMGLDTRRISDVGKRMSTSQMLGIVRIGADTNPEIKDTTDREKLVDTKENVEFCAIIKAIIGQLENLRDMDRERKRKEPSIVDLFSSIDPNNLVENARKAVETGKSADDVLKIVQDYESESRAQIADVRNRLYYYGQVATAGSMSSFILHEIRGGLTSIKRFLKTIAKKKADFDSKTTDYFDIAEKSHARMLMVANSFAPLYSTNFKQQKHTSNLLEELNMSISFLDEKIKKHGILINTNVGPDVFIGLHSGEIQTVLVNLIDNAIYWITQEASDQKEIVVSAGFMSGTKERMTISISDTGTGVPRENAEKIFEPGVTGKPHGIGMGMVIVAEILARHQGKIALQYPSELSGATFVFDVPLG